MNRDNHNIHRAYQKSRNLMEGGMEQIYNAPFKSNPSQPASPESVQQAFNKAKEAIKNRYIDLQKGSKDEDFSQESMQQLDQLLKPINDFVQLILKARDLIPSFRGDKEVLEFLKNTLGRETYNLAIKAEAGSAAKEENNEENKGSQGGEFQGSGP